MSEDYKSIFGTYKIKFQNESYHKIATSLDTAIERPYGLCVKLCLQFEWEIDKEKKKQVLSKYNEFIFSLNISFENNEEINFLKLFFPTNLQTLRMKFSRGTSFQTDVLSDLIERNAISLKHLTINGLNVEKDSNFAPNQELNSLELLSVDGNTATTFITMCNSSITELKMFDVTDLEVEQVRDLHLPKLKRLHLWRIVDGIATIALIKSCKDTLTELNLRNVKNLYAPEIKNLQLPNLKKLSLSNTNYANKNITVYAALELIKAGKDTISELSIKSIECFNEAEIFDIKLKNVSKLELLFFEGNAALEILKTCKNTIKELKIHSINNLSVAAINQLKMPNVQVLDVNDINTLAALAFIQVTKDNISYLKWYNCKKLPETIFYHDLDLPNLKRLEFAFHSDGDLALNIIQANKDTLEQLKMDYINNLNLSVVDDLELPILTRIDLEHMEEKAALALANIGTNKIPVKVTLSNLFKKKVEF